MVEDLPPTGVFGGRNNAAPGDEGHYSRVSLSWKLYFSKVKTVLIPVTESN
jgi:hypothetical protein